MTRRDLIRKISIGGTTFIVVPSFFTQCTKPAGDNSGTDSNGISFPLIIDLSTPAYSSLNSAGGSVVIHGIIIANTGNDIFVSLDSTCTHQGCTIDYDLTSNTFPCPCHGSTFSTTGAVINGPASRAEKSHNVTKNGNTLTITK